jgi:quercetin dioxygenase-like cupin family protein
MLPVLASYLGLIAMEKYVKPVIKFQHDMPEPLNIVGETITILSSNTETSDYELFLQQGPVGSGPGPHSHEWDETFYVLDGKIDFGYDDEKMVAGPGTLVHLPSGTRHWFRFAAGGGKMISITGRKSNASKFFSDLAREIPSGEADLEKLTLVADRNGVNFRTS